MAHPQQSDEIIRLREIGKALRGQHESLPLIPISFTDEEEPTVAGPRPDTLPPKSLGRRAVDRTAHELGKVSRPVQILAAVTALLAALTPLIEAIVRALR